MNLFVTLFVIVLAIWVIFTNIFSIRDVYRSDSSKLSKYVRYILLITSICIISVFVVERILYLIN